MQRNGARADKSKRDRARRKSTEGEEEGGEPPRVGGGSGIGGGGGQASTLVCGRDPSGADEVDDDAPAPSACWQGSHGQPNASAPLLVKLRRYRLLISAQPSHPSDISVKIVAHGVF